VPTTDTTDVMCYLLIVITGLDRGVQ